jgi:OOP family OmpA-OmpF porin
VPASIITTSWKGDTVQPFAENDKNRVAITVANGTGEKQEKVITKKFRLEEVRYKVQ